MRAFVHGGEHGFRRSIRVLFAFELRASPDEALAGARHQYPDRGLDRWRNGGRVREGTRLRAIALTRPALGLCKSPRAIVRFVLRPDRYPARGNPFLRGEMHSEPGDSAACGPDRLNYPGGEATALSS